jgi:hypothetical protein
MFIVGDVIWMRPSGSLTYLAGIKAQTRLIR